MDEQISEKKQDNSPNAWLYGGPTYAFIFTRNNFL